jgi:hypothetical protein
MTDAVVIEEVLSPYWWLKAIHARGACEKCGSEEDLDAHHIDEDRSNNVLSNGELLCVECHDAHHNMGGAYVALRAGGRNQPKSSRQRAAVALRLWWKRNPEARDKRAKEMRRRHVEKPGFGDSSGFTGKHHTDKERQKMSDALKNSEKFQAYLARRRKTAT